MRRIYFIIAVVLISIQGQTAELKDRVKEYTLKNGLRVLFVERHGAPTFAAFTLFPSGRTDEPKGKAGIAHVVEHMLFKGTKTIGTKDYVKEALAIAKLDSLVTLLIYEKSNPMPDSIRISKLEEEVGRAEKEAADYMKRDEKIDAIYSKNGVSGFNAGTGMDGTTYIVGLPSNKFELWARITADIIENTVFREFYKEKEVVMNEIRGGEDEPEEIFWDEFMDMAFSVHPYGKPIAGKVEDIQRLTIKDIKDFYLSQYRVSNAIIGIVGDLEFEELKLVMDKYFSHLPQADTLIRITEVEPIQTEERRKVIELDAEPKIGIAYHIPTYPDFDTYVLKVISSILSEGRTSRLYKNIVETKVAQSADCYSGTPGIRYPNLFVFGSQPITQHSVQEIETLFYSEIAKLKTKPVNEYELKKVKNQVKASFIRRLQSNWRIASQLVSFEGYFGGWEKTSEYIELIDKVMPEDIIRVANKYFTQENRTVLTSIKKVGESKSLIELAIEYYREKAGKEPDEEMMKVFNGMMQQIENIERMQKLSIPQSEKIQAIKQAIDALTGGER
ncbi:MAG: insulinase family protein [Candidatus Stahlbacteria bacterium]|nr:insulinase family protein [Candidatus Stahlbacteria bacterium]